jgi:hypothetical protein
MSLADDDAAVCARAVGFGPKLPTRQNRRGLASIPQGPDERLGPVGRTTSADDDRAVRRGCRRAALEVAAGQISYRHPAARARPVGGLGSGWRRRATQNDVAVGRDAVCLAVGEAAAERSECLEDVGVRLCVCRESRNSEPGECRAGDRAHDSPLSPARSSSAPNKGGGPVDQRTAVRCDCEEGPARPREAAPAMRSARRLEPLIGSRTDLDLIWLWVKKRPGHTLNLRSRAVWGSATFPRAGGSS